MRSACARSGGGRGDGEARRRAGPGTGSGAPAARPHLVEHGELDGVQAQAPPAAAPRQQEVEDAARRAHDDVDPAPQRRPLPADGDAAVHAQRVERRRDSREVVCHLLREFAGGRQDEHTRGAAFLSAPAASREKALDDWESKGERLALTGPRAAHDVLAVEDPVEGERLNGKQVRDTFARERCGCLGANAKRRDGGVSSCILAGDTSGGLLNGQGAVCGGSFGTAPLLADGGRRRRRRLFRLMLLLVD